VNNWECIRDVVWVGIVKESSFFEYSQRGHLFKFETEGATSENFPFISDSRNEFCMN